MIRTAAIALAALMMTASVTPAVAQENGRPQGERPSRERPERSDGPRAGGCPQVDVSEAVRRATGGREGRFLGASVQCTTVVIRWEDPGGRVRDIRVQGRER